MEKLIEQILTKEWLESFEIGGIVEKESGGDREENELVVELREKKSQIPPEIPRSVNFESKGFCDPLELVDHPIGGHPTYIRFYRRRWRDKETKKEYHNHYDLRFPGTKLTHRFANFLKEEDRKGKISKFRLFYPDLWNLVKEDFRVVQKSSIGVRKLWYKRIFNGS